MDDPSYPQMWISANLYNKTYPTQIACGNAVVVFDVIV